MEKVTNKNRRKFESDHYIFVVFRNYYTKKIFPCMFTEIELSDLEKINAKWLKLKNNFLYPVTIGFKQTYLWYSKKLGHIFRISPSQLDRAMIRAERNPEDFPEKNLIQKILSIF